MSVAAGGLEPGWCGDGASGEHAGSGSGWFCPKWRFLPDGRCSAVGPWRAVARPSLLSLGCGEVRGSGAPGGELPRGMWRSEVAQGC